MKRELCLPILKLTTVPVAEWTIINNIKKETEQSGQRVARWCIFSELKIVKCCVPGNAIK